MSRLSLNSKVRIKHRIASAGLLSLWDKTHQAVIEYIQCEDNRTITCNEATLLSLSSHQKALADTKHTACIIKANFHHVNSELTHFNMTSELINIDLTQLNLTWLHRHYIEGPHKVHINIDVFKGLWIWQKVSNTMQAILW